MALMGKASFTWPCLAFLLLFAVATAAAAPEPAETEPPQVVDEARVEGSADSPYRYDPTGKVDPFDAFIVTRAPEFTQIREGDAAAEELRRMLAILEDLKRPKTELQTIPLSAIQLTSIVTAGEQRVAMVRGPDDTKGYMLKKGTYIGENGGVVEEIISEERMTDLGTQLIRKVVIKEPYLDADRKISYRNVELKMPGSFH